MKRLVCTALILVAGCASSLVDYESTTYVVRSGDTLYSIAWRHGLDPDRLAAWNGLANPDLIRVGQRLRLRPAAATAASARPARSPVPTPTAPDEPPPTWQWPTRGAVVSTFGQPGALASGIGIAGVEGQPVNAAAGGRVVYAGSGLIGYGQLVIIRHNETYLSAYGHNRRLFVRQGDEVARGQTIAEMGLGPGQSPRLHFEIRRNGNPIDPLPQLSSGS